MAFYKITYNQQYGFATIHNYGCTFRCPTCSYKLRSGAEGKPGLVFPKPQHYLEMTAMKDVIRRLPISTLNFMGGEPTVAGDMLEMLRFAKEELGLITRLGHTNGSGLPLPCLDGANVGLKAWDRELHLKITGHDRDRILKNVADAHKQGISMKINIVFIPGLVDLDQVEKIAAWTASLDKDIPFNIMGYIPVPGQPYLQPTALEMKEAEEISSRYLSCVTSSRLSPDNVLRLADRDDRFAVKRLL